MRGLRVHPSSRGCPVQALLGRGFCHYLSGEAAAEIESQWTARKREQRGIFPTVKVRLPAENPAQAKLGRGTLESNLRCINPGHLPSFPGFENGETWVPAADVESKYKLYYVDSFAAALAIEYKATLVTSDSDFRRLGHGFPTVWLKA